MRRREFIVALGGAVAGWPLPARAQEPMPVIGYLNSGAARPMASLVTALHDGLRQAGYVEGRNVAIEYRWSEGRSDRLSELAAELVRLRVSVIVAVGGSAPAQAASGHQWGHARTTPTRAVHAPAASTTATASDFAWSPSQPENLCVERPHCRSRR